MSFGSSFLIFCIPAFISSENGKKYRSCLWGIIGINSANKFEAFLNKAYSPNMLTSKVKKNLLNMFLEHLLDRLILWGFGVFLGESSWSWLRSRTLYFWFQLFWRNLRAQFFFFLPQNLFVLLCSLSLHLSSPRFKSALEFATLCL